MAVAEESPREESPPYHDSPQSRYRRYAAHYSDLFRASIDYYRPEKPRQVLCGFFLLSFIFILGSVYSPLEEDAATNARRGALTVIVCLCVYSFLQTKDTLLVRPHPGFWRIIHALGILHLLIVSALFVMNTDSGRTFIALLLPGVKEHQLRKKNPFEGTVDLDCRLSFHTLKIQFSKIWAISHVIGFAAKMIVFRDWAFCFVLSLVFELCELSFQWLMPELQECWWDSILLDVVVCNTLGMFLGVGILRWLSSYQYDWMGHRPFYKKLLVRFLPFTFSQWNWGFFLTFTRFSQAILLLVMSVLTELNAFFLMYALDIPPGHLFHFLRIVFVCFLGVPAVAEHYHYINSGGTRRIGHNSWLFFCVIVIESLVCVKYASRRFERLMPDLGVLLPWSVFCGLLSIWCFFRYFIVGTEKEQLISRIRSSQYGGVSPLNTPEAKSHHHQQPLVGSKSRVPSFLLHSQSSLEETLRFRGKKEEEDRMSPPHHLTGDLEDTLEMDASKRRQRWGILYTLGLLVVQIPVACCCFPLLFLCRFYDYD